MIRAHDGHAECCLNMNTKLALIVNFKSNACKKMNVITKISCYFECSVVTLKLRKQYLNTVTYNTPNFQKTVRFFWPTLYICLKNLLCNLRGYGLATFDETWQVSE